MIEYKIFTTFFFLDTLVWNVVLRSSDECEYDSPNLALFKYDKNKPQRLSYLGSVDVNKSKTEEWCIRQYFASNIRVAPKCILYPDEPEFVNEANFHEIF